MIFDGISTVMPIYIGPGTEHDIAKTASDIRRAALSVVTQDVPIPLELVVIDDGSRFPLKELPQLVDIFSHPLVRTIRLSQNHGLTYALNAGLNKAQYGLIARIDGDDVWRPHKLTKQLKLFQSDPDLTIVGTGMRAIRADGGVGKDHIRGSSWGDMLQFFASEGCPLPHGSILARRDIFSLLGGYSHAPQYQHCEDFALWGVWLRFFKAAMLPEILFEYHLSETQISSRHEVQQRTASRIIQSAFLALGNHGKIPSALEKVARALGTCLLNAGRILYAAWRYYDYILVDPELEKMVRILMPDRRVFSYAKVVQLLTDRFAYINLNESFDRSISAHVRILHTRADLEKLVSAHCDGP
jgi:hypothetical protein